MEMEGSPLMKVSEALRTIVCEGLAVDDFKVFNCGTPWEFIVVPTIPQGERILRRDGREFVGKSLLLGLSGRVSTVRMRFSGR